MEGQPQPQDHSAEELQRVKQRARSLMSGVPGCCGFGIGDGTIRVYVTEPAVARKLPEEIEGVPIEPVVVGEITTY